MYQSEGKGYKESYKLHLYGRSLLASAMGLVRIGAKREEYWFIPFDMRDFCLTRPKRLERFAWMIVSADNSL